MISFADNIAKISKKQKMGPDGGKSVGFSFLFNKYAGIIGPYREFKIVFIFCKIGGPKYGN